MYPHFIEVHDGEDNQCEISVNIDNIVNFHVDEDGVSIIEVVSGEFYSITETYDELKELIRSAGCHIEKGDPRLDQTKPITKQMIMSENMVGEPVWNSNNGRWYQIANWSNHEDQFYMELQGIWEILKYSDKELEKYPLYRMKVAQ